MGKGGERSDLPSCYQARSMSRKTQGQLVLWQHNLNQLSQQTQICCDQSQLQSHTLLSCNTVGITWLMFLCSVHACSPPQDALIKVSAAAFPSTSLKISFWRKFTPQLISSSITAQQNNENWAQPNACCFIPEKQIILLRAGGEERDPQVGIRICLIPPAFPLQALRYSSNPQDSSCKIPA